MDRSIESILVEAMRIMLERYRQEDRNINFYYILEDIEPKLDWYKYWYKSGVSREMRDIYEFGDDFADQYGEEQSTLYGRPWEEAEALVEEIISTLSAGGEFDTHKLKWNGVSPVPTPFKDWVRTLWALLFVAFVALLLGFSQHQKP
jgi:hypothetical protein